MQRLRFEYGTPLGHPNLYAYKPEELAKDELAHWTSGASGGYAEDVSIRRVSDSKVRIRVYGENVGVGIQSKPVHIEEFTAKAPPGASVNVDCKPWEPPTTPAPSRPALPRKVKK